MNRYEEMEQAIHVSMATPIAGGSGRPEKFETDHPGKPPIFANVDNNMSIAREEVFGPVLVLIPDNDEKEAVEIANDTPCVLSA